jgi:uncharacterized protein
MPTELVVRAAGLAPVKGMRHLALERLDLDEDGPVGDHRWCLVDVRAGRVLRTVQHPSLIAVAARVDDEVLALTLPTGESVAAVPEETGETVTCDYWGRAVPLALTDGPHAALMSDHLGQDVRLAAAPRGGVVFAAPLTLVGTASLEALAEQAGRPVDSARFRPNLVVETDEAWVEDAWLGREVRVGDALLRVGGPVPRCVVIDHHPVTSAKDVRLLKQLVGSRPTNRAGEPMFGVYADVVRAGAVTSRPAPDH